MEYRKIYCTENMDVEVDGAIDRWTEQWWECAVCGEKFTGKELETLMTQQKSFNRYGRDFHEWLVKQHSREDPVGQLASDLRRDNVPPPQEYDSFRIYILRQRGGRQAYTEWLEYAWQSEHPN